MLCLFRRLCVFVALLTLTGLALTGCGSSEPASSGSRGGDPAEKTSDEALGAKLDRARSAFEEAQANGLSFYAPQHVQQAGRQLQGLQSAAQEGNRSEALDHAKQLLDTLHEAQRLRNQVQPSTDSLLRRLQSLKGHGADTSLPEEYRAARSAIKNLAQAPENGSEVSEAREDAEEALDALRDKVVRSFVLEPVQKRIDRLDEMDAEDTAPRSVQRAKNAYKQAVAALQEGSADSTSARARRIGAQAMAQAEWAEYVSRRVRHLEELSEEELEREVRRQIRALNALGATPQALREEAPAPSGSEADVSLAEGIKRHRTLQRATEQRATGQRATEAQSGQFALDFGPLSEPLPSQGATGSSLADSAYVTPAERLPSVKEMRSFVVSRSFEPTYGAGVELPQAGEANLKAGAFRTPEGKTLNFVRNAVIVRSSSRAAADSVAKRWHGQIRATLSSESGKPERYLVQTADLIKNAPTQKELQDAVHGVAPGAPRGTYHFSSDHARALFWIAIHEAHSRGHDIEILWLEDKNSLRKTDLSVFL